MNSGAIANPSMKSSSSGRRVSGATPSAAPWTGAPAAHVDAEGRERNEKAEQQGECHGSGGRRMSGFPTIERRDSFRGKPPSAPSLAFDDQYRRSSGYAVGFESGANWLRRNTWRGLCEHTPFIIAPAVNSAAAADNEFAIDCGVLFREALEIAGISCDGTFARQRLTCDRAHRRSIACPASAAKGAGAVGYPTDDLAVPTSAQCLRDRQAKPTLLPSDEVRIIPLLISARRVAT